MPAKIKRVFSKIWIYCSLILLASGNSYSGNSLQDFAIISQYEAPVEIYIAKEIITLDPSKPNATAVAVEGKRIVATGTQKEVQAAIGNQPFKLHDTYKDKV
jgi:hypothetical protein